MNKVILIGRLTKDADIRYSQGDNPMAIARFNLAVDRRKTKQNDNPGADFISCVAFGKTAEFYERFGKKGTKFCIEGHIQTGSYDNKDGQKVYTTDVVIEQTEFAESKNNNSGVNANSERPQNTASDNGGFMDLPDGMDELPFA